MESQIDLLDVRRSELLDRVAALEVRRAAIVMTSRGALSSPLNLVQLEGWLEIAHPF